MDSFHGLHVMTLANSIIGVSILAMPYCFKQCGIILSICLLILSSILSRLACHFLLKSAIKAKLKTFEFLAYHAFGALGKFVVEVGLIGFLLGTCIAFFVVMGDLGPQIVSQLTETPATSKLRTFILVSLAIFCVLPLGLLRSVKSLSGVCTATIGFYACLVLKIIGESVPLIRSWQWVDQVEYWNVSGILQCLPIFSMALFCQTQLFEIYQSMPNASLEKMNNVVRMAVHICTGVYIFVGVFGYIAISGEASVGGNILLSFQPSLATEVIKIGFVLSVAFSFPLVIFPCRASIYSLLYKSSYNLLDQNPSNNAPSSHMQYIPDGKFRLITLFVVALSLSMGVIIPNIELVLGLVGSTIGVLVCVIFPATSFICLTSKNTNERIVAQIMLFIGVVVMVLGTYANIYAIEEVATNPVELQHDNIIQIINEVNVEQPIREFPAAVMTTPRQTEFNGVEINKNPVKPEKQVDSDLKEIRHEPPQPQEPEIENIDKEMRKDKQVADTPKLSKDVVENDPLKQPNLGKPAEVDIIDIEAIKKEDVEEKLAGNAVKVPNELLNNFQQDLELHKKIIVKEEQLLKQLEEKSRDDNKLVEKFKIIERKQKELDQRLNDSIKANKEHNSVEIPKDLIKNEHNLFNEVKNEINAGNKVNDQVEILLNKTEQDTIIAKSQINTDAIAENVKQSPPLIKDPVINLLQKAKENRTVSEVNQNKLGVLQRDILANIDSTVRSKREVSNKTNSALDVSTAHVSNQYAIPIFVSRDLKSFHSSNKTVS